MIQSTTSWASLNFVRNRDDERSPAPGVTTNLHRSAERFDAVHQAGESRSFTDICSSDSVIVNRERGWRRRF